MKISYATALLALSCIAVPTGAQESGGSRGGTPVQGFPGDPVQGGALKEYRLSPGSSAAPGNGIDTSSMPPPAPAQELVVQSRNGVRWLCGGIGEREVNYMKNEAKRYDMMLTFATRNGAYLADVNVHIVDEDGRILLQTECGGPIMLVDMPSDGAYRIRAEAEGYEVTRMVKLEAGQGKRRHVAMTWPLSANEVQAGPTSSGGNGQDEGDEIEDDDALEPVS